MKTEANPVDAWQKTATPWFGKWLVWAEIAVIAISALFAAFVYSWRSVNGRHLLLPAFSVHPGA